MAEEPKVSIFKAVLLNIESNNTDHHTNQITIKELIVRRGQPFTVTVKLSQPFNSDRDPLTVVALTGTKPSEEYGTISYFGIPDVERSASAKGVWKIRLKKKVSAPKKGILHLAITPATDTPIGDFILTVKHRDEETLLAITTVLFNPWCANDAVFLPDEMERQEYVMNEHGLVYRGSANHHSLLCWDFGQFEDDMGRICMKILDKSLKHLEDPALDCCNRCDPIYVGRVVSAMINSEGDNGVLAGNWGSSFVGGYSPSHWQGSHAILKRWLNSDCHQVKYGQCWVFAAVMCSVMRFLGIPCRVVTNFESAHDTNKNLIIDTYHVDYGVTEKKSPDSVWNFHVWVEGWMKRPDLGEDGKYDGWQVLDPTPQETSDGVYCCGPASVKAIRHGHVGRKFDVPFVFAEVNADCIDWLIFKDGSKKRIYSDTKRVGAAIVTKCVGRDNKKYITNKYKPKEGSDKERLVFKYAILKIEEGDEVEEDEENDEGTSVGTTEITPDAILPPPPMNMRYEEVDEPRNGKDVNLRLVLNSENSVARTLSIAISVQVMRHNGTPAKNLQNYERKETLQPGKELTIPILIPFSTYHPSILEGASMKVSAVVTDLDEPDNIYLAEDDIVLIEPSLSIQVSGEAKLSKVVKVHVTFKNPANETLTDCKLTLSGSGLLREDTISKLPDLPPKCQFRIGVSFVPYKKGKKTLLADLDSKTFRDIKGSCTVIVSA